MSGPFGAGALQYFSGEKEFYPFKLDQSLRFNDGDSPSLSRTPLTAGNRRTFIWSGWVKRGDLGSGQGIFGTATGSATEFFIMQFTSSDTIFIQGASTPSSSLVENVRLGTTQVFRDVGAWYHIVLAVDNTQATASNRLKLYVNGNLITNFSSGNNTYPTTQNFETPINSTSFPLTVGAINTGSLTPLDGYLAEVNFIDAPIFTAATTSGSATVTGISSTATLKVGMAVSSSTTSVIPDGTTIQSIDSSTQITLSANATATNGSVSLTFSATVSLLGETKNDIWVPKEYTGPYGTNGFRLTFEDDTTVEGFNTVLYNGNGASQSVEGVGFSPDFVWIKARDSSTLGHLLFDTLRGANKAIFTNNTDDEFDYAANSADVMSSFNNNGFTVAATNSSSTNSSSQKYVGWCWKAGGTPSATNSAGEGATPTAGSVKIDGANLGSALEGTIPATKLSANTTYGFSIVTYTGTGSAGTIAHGLGAVPKWIIVKKTSGAQAWQVYHVGNTVDENGNTVSPEDEKLTLNTTAHTVTDSTTWNNTAPTSTVFSVGSGNGTNQLNQTYVAYVWCEKSGYSKFGSYTGNGSSSGPSVTTGFNVGYVLIKKADQSGTSWVVLDRTRDTDTQGRTPLFAGESAQEVDSPNLTYSSTGFQVTTGSSGTNTSGKNYIFMAFADTRDYAFWTDRSGNENDWQPTNLEHTDVVPDRPTNTFATLNPLDKGSGVTLSNGNLVTDLVADDAVRSTFHFEIDGNESFYAEMLCQTTPNNNSALGVVISNDDDLLDASGGTAGSYWYFANGKKRSTGSETSYGATWTTGDIIGIAVSGGAVTFYKNNASQGQAFTGLTGSYSIAIGEFNGNGPALRINYGQDSSFGGLKISQGNTDANDNGDFFYAPPTDHLALCTENLPNPAIDPNADETPDQYFNTVLYTGNSSTQSITGVGFQPDWLWVKNRQTAYSHALVDVVRGATKSLSSDLPAAERTSDITSLDSDGFSLQFVNATGSFSENQGSQSYVSWNWKAGGTAVSNTDGTVTSTVSANTEAGFSIVGYTGTGSADTVGHGLSAKPQMILVKNRGTGTREWLVYNEESGATKYMFITTNAATPDSSAWNNTEPTSSVFTVGSSASSNNLNEGHVAYCFHSVDGYSKFGAYKGNGSNNGAFVFTGFRPAWVMIKRTNTTGSWKIFDNKRPNSFNVIDARIEPDNNGVEDTNSSYSIDLVSNGFKLRGTSGEQNGAGSTFIYLAFAEQPFKYANAR